MRPRPLGQARAERDVGLTEALSGELLAEPEVGHRRDPVSDDLAEVHDPLAADRCECLVVERCACVDVRALDGKVIEHATILAQPDSGRIPGGGAGLIAGPATRIGLAVEGSGGRRRPGAGAGVVRRRADHSG